MKKYFLKNLPLFWNDSTALVNGDSFEILKNKT